MKTPIFGLFILIIGLAGAQKAWREDDQCGPEWPAENGQPAICRDIPPFPTCCQDNGHCGWDCAAGAASSGSSAGRPAAVAPSPVTQKPVFSSNGRYRSDGRCGAANPLEDGVTPAECDPNSEYWCCSDGGWCGGTQEHCYCDTCVNYRPIDVKNGVRSDRRCGPDFPLDDGTPSGCDGNSGNPCCSKHGYCGPGAAHCDCVGCVDYRSGGAVEVPLMSGRVRNDRRCGGEFPLDNGEPSECDPDSANPCCSKWGFCGPGADHCECTGCKDYRPAAVKAAQDFANGGKVRTDRRCGSEFPLPDGSGFAECDPKSEKYCCSKWGYCGGDADHCDCPECVNFRLGLY